jgi:hypothetical protein
MFPDVEDILFVGASGTTLTRLINFGRSASALAEERDILGQTISTRDDESEEVNGGRKKQIGFVIQGAQHHDALARDTQATLIPVLVILIV